jgi:hypothetical protein
VEAALAEPRCFPLKKKIAPPHPTQKPPYNNIEDHDDIANNAQRLHV